jgi:NADPH:quinone reductase-like Zn-dependent oxidoreductase
MAGKAIYADHDGKVVIKDFPIPQPPEGEILVQVLYSGVNPSDIRTLKFFNCRHHLLGNEFCGRVLESPILEDTSFLKAGDIVAGYVDGSKDRPLRYGTHQPYISVPSAWIYRVPENLPQADAAAITIVVQTANDALFNRLHVPLPDATPAHPEGTLVIWGGATSVGMAAIQLGRASGIHSIVATASTKQHDYLKSLGATHCFDYKDDNVVQKVKAVLQASRGPIWGLDAAGAPDSQTLLANALSSHNDIHLASVLLQTDERFQVTLAARHIDVSFDLPDGQSLFFAAHPDEADRMWKALAWVVKHYGAEFRPLPVRIFEGTAEKALEEIIKVEAMGTFGKLVLKHPLK